VCERGEGEGGVRVVALIGGRSMLEQQAPFLPVKGAALTRHEPCVSDALVEEGAADARVHSRQRVVQELRGGTVQDKLDTVRYRIAQHS
jgi:hypothetical protein